MKLQGKQVWITGASRGIGLATAVEMSKRGAHLHLCLRNIDQAEQKRVLDNFSTKEHIKFYKLDLSSRQSLDDFCQQRLAEKSVIDIFFHNGGLLTGGLLENQNLDEIYQMYQVNLLAPTHLSHTLAPLMLARPESYAIYNSSVSGILYLPCATTYAASKSGLAALARCLQSELKGTNLKTMVLFTPGIKTRMYDQISELYGQHLDLSALSSISTEAYADKICEAIEAGKTELWPRGSVRVALFLARFSPKIFRYLSTLGFKR